MQTIVTKAGITCRSIRVKLNSQIITIIEAFRKITGNEDYDMYFASASTRASNDSSSNKNEQIWLLSLFGDEINFHNYSLKNSKSAIIVAPL